LDTTTVVVTLTTALGPLVVEWFKAQLAARRPPAPGKPAEPINVIVNGDVHITSKESLF
jgi:hypothetical protein